MLAMETFKREVKSLAEDVVDIVWDGGGGSGTTEQQDEQIPVYERASAGRAFGLHWAQPLPAQISAPIGRFATTR